MVCYISCPLPPPPPNQAATTTTAAPVFVCAGCNKKYLHSSGALLCNTHSPPWVKKARGHASIPKDEDTRDSEGGVSAGTAPVEGIGDGLITVMPAAFFNTSTLGRLSATGLLGGLLVLEDDATGVDETAVGGGGPAVSLPASAGGSGGGGGYGAASNPDVKTPQVHTYSFHRTVVLSSFLVSCC